MGDKMIKACVWVTDWSMAFYTIKG